MYQKTRIYERNNDIIFRKYGLLLIEKKITKEL